LERTEHNMVRWMCWVSLNNRISSVELNGSLGVEGGHGRMRWFVHLERKGGDDWVSTCRGFEVAGPKGRGRSRSRKTWVNVSSNTCGF